MLVMFFMFLILVFAIHICGVNSAPQGANNPDFSSFSTRNVQILGFKDGLRNNVSTQKPMFQIIRNVPGSGSHNLKSNIFDKMLSDEMFSIKQKSFEKDLIHSSTVKKVKQSTAPTPTIEVHQKWSVVDLFTQSVITEDGIKTADDEDKVKLNSENSVESDMIHEDIENNNNISDNKILELRSLPSNDEHMHHHASAKCSCTRQFPEHQVCTQTSTDSSVSVSYTVYPLYLQYQTYFFNDYNANPYENIYYHPKVVDDLKLPRKTKRRKTTPYPDDLYYDDNKSKEEKKKTRGQRIDDNEVYAPKPKYKDRGPNFVMNLDYDLVDDRDKTNGNGGSGKKEKDRIENLHFNEDLNDVYNNEIKKKCYCSQSTPTLFDQKTNLFVFLFVHVFKFVQEAIVLFE